MNQRHSSSGFAFIVLLLLILLVVAGFFFFKMAAPVPNIPLTGNPGSLTGNSGSLTNPSNPTPQLTVEVLAEPRTVWAGFITDALGKPIAGASVSHLGNNPSPASTLSDDNGHFRLILIADTAPQVSIEAQGYFQVQVLLSGDSSATYTL
ncbi:MAG: carboxypeptidase regulatory-like domain-containing protein, partial [Planctomycetes bacterium]|nr:carboxypeptidase regulatory-like domain-containing protein [Planctomycetota bacterium]MBT7130989.1 carboxypeptidase regulatory-like domain-containing protein [Planctomycetota bacterium]